MSLGFCRLGLEASGQYVCEVLKVSRRSGRGLSNFGSIGFQRLRGKGLGFNFSTGPGAETQMANDMHVHAFTIIRHSFTPLCMRSMHTTCRWRCPCFAVVISTGSPVHPLTRLRICTNLRTPVHSRDGWMDGWMSVRLFSESEPKQSCTQRARHLGASCPSFQAAFLGSTRRPTTVLPR